MKRIALTLSVFLLFISTGNLHADSNVVVMPDSGLKLTERQKTDLILHPERFFERADEHLLQAFQADPARTIVIYRPPRGAERPPYSVFYFYDRIRLSETRFVDPRIVCGGTGNPPIWGDCSDNSRFAIELPDHNSIWINDRSISDDDFVDILTAFNDAVLRTHSGEPVRSNHVNHILLRTRRSGVYVLTADTPTGETVKLNLRRNQDQGVETYEIVDWSCGNSQGSPQ